MKKYSFIILCLLLLCIVYSCKTDTYSCQGEKKLQISSLTLDTINVTAPENTSYYGMSGLSGDSLFFYDKALSYLYHISVDGKTGSRKLGLGHSSKELPCKNLDVCYDNKEQKLIGLGSTLDVYIYDEPKDVVRKLDLASEEGKKDYTSPYAYSTWDEFIMYANNGKVYYNILGEAEGARITDEEDYFKNAAILMELNLKTGVQKPVGHYSDYYDQNKKHVRHLPHIYFDIDDDGTFYVTFQADPSIYHYSKDFELLDTFGFEGTDMDTHYSECALGAEGFGNAYVQDMDKVGYYYWLKRANGYTFRSYRTSGDAVNDRLQVYDCEYNLIADVDVPKNFRVAGYIAPYFITQINTPEEEDNLYFYRFKL